MIARNFKAVGWVAAIGVAALICYIFSLRVAAERAELTQLDRQISQVQQSIGTLNTELGTRGRVQQLQHWASNDFGFQAPAANQFVNDEVSLARLDVRSEAPVEAPVQMASAPAPARVEAPAARIVQAAAAPRVAQAGAERRAEPARSEDRLLLHRASLDRGQTATPASSRRERAAAERPVRTASTERGADRGERRTGRPN